ncbi:MAG: TGS domain-containing protein [Candidatus Latescibacteria bacterium]|jgi:hypothetical protein|nr:TGS domain-containing protein [Candidatus Latescibacterota bacterium]
MPANLTPQYLRAEELYRKATSPEEKIELLQEMLAIIPKHKGTDHLRGDLRKRLSEHKREAQQHKKKGARSATLDKIDKEGAGQAALIGAPNSGKSSIVATCTAATVQVADFPFSTFKPVPGMMAYEDVQVQLVDLPPVSEEYTESWVFSITRNADLVLLTVDLSQPAPEEQVFELSSLLEAKHLMLAGSRDLETPNLSIAVKPTLILATKCDTEEADAGLASLQEAYGEEFPIFSLSVQTGHHLEEMPRRVFQALEVLRIYTKAPGKKPDLEQPYILPIGSTVLDVAAAVHRDIAENLRFARIWGSEKYEGQQVKRDHVVEDRDILELHG